jgi:uncharacterized protein (DUF1800 family)
MAWTREDAAHLLRRAGFGGSLAQVESLYAAGQAGAIDSLLNYDAQADAVWDDPNPLDVADPLKDSYSAQRNLLFKLATSTRPLQARLTWFWHGHFTSSLEKTNAALMIGQIETWRQFATGKFLDFLLAMYQDGAMLQYLDGDPSSKQHPNENFARENFELFTTGIGPYTERDVREAARAFTGWEVSENNLVTFIPSAHDAGSKTILGQVGSFNGDDVMRLVFARPETRRRICTKLYQHFVSERVNLVELNNLMRAWTASGGDLKAVMRALLSSPGFWDPRNRGLLVKGALEYCLGLVQRLGVTIDQSVIERIIGNLGEMGQDWLYPPNPAGYATGLRLTGASQLLTRYRFAYTAIYNIDGDAVTATMSAGLPASPTADMLIDTLSQRLGVVNLGSNTRTAIKDWIGTTPITSSNLKSRTLGTLHLLACSPEFQVI